MRTLVHRLFFRTILALVSVFVLFFGEVSGQVATNGGSGLAATYPSLAAAITALNGKTITSTVVITLTGDEIAPAGGYSITAQGAGVNTITIQGNSSIITASPSQVSGRMYDAIFKIIGGDYITLQNFTMKENPSNTTIDSASNNMTEWGVALLIASGTNGSQHNTIQNNIISLDRNYKYSFGIYSSVRHSATNPRTGSNPGSTSGSNSINFIYKNQISNVNMGIVFVGSGDTPAYMDTGNDIGGSSPATGNSITNWGYTASNLGYYTYKTVSKTIFGINVNNQINVNVSYNTLVSAALGANTAAFRGILMDYTNDVPAGSITNNISHNTITISSASTTTSAFAGIQTTTRTVSNVTLNIDYNVILNCAVTGTNSGNTLTGIYNQLTTGSLSISNNSFLNNTSTATTGGFDAIINEGAVVNTIAIDNNQLGNASGNAITFNVATSGYVHGIRNIKAASTCTLSNSGNNFQGFIHQFPGTGRHYYIEIKENCFANVQMITNNTFTNLNVKTSGGVYFIYSLSPLTNGGSQTITNNSIVTAFNKPVAGEEVDLYFPEVAGIANSSLIFANNNFSNITVAGATNLFGCKVHLAIANTKTMSNNTFSNWNCASGTTYVIYTSLGTSTVEGNTISNMTGIGNIIGINLYSAGTGSVNSNTISGLFGTGSGLVYGIGSAFPNATISKNKIYNLSNSTPTGVVKGININNSAAGTVTLKNNFIGDLRTPHSNVSNYNSDHYLIGLSFSSTVSGVVINAYNNTVYLNASSDGGSFGSSAVFASITPTINLRNNIFVNKSIPKGVGFTVCYRRNGTDRTNYAKTSDNNLFYVGSGTNNFIFFDNTQDGEITSFLSYQMVIGPDRDSLSINEDPHFISTNGSDPFFLHIDNTCHQIPTAIESGGASISGVTDDFDGDLRWGETYPSPGYTGLGSAPDIGADEFNSQSVLVTASAGSTGVSYQTLRAAFAKINDGTHRGNITIKLYCNTVENAPAVLYQTGTYHAGFSSYNYVHIFPAISGLSVTKNTSGELIDLNGADKVTIDGRVNRTGAADLSIIHTVNDNSSRNIRFIYSAQSDTIQYCKISGACSSPDAGIIYFANSTAGSGNINNVIQNCEFTNSGTRPRNVICSNALPAPTANNSTNTIANNLFYDFFKPDSASNGIYLESNSSAWKIIGNSFFETTSFGPLATAEYNAIRISSSVGNSFTITGNYIGGSTAFCGGTAFTKTSGNNVFTAIHFDVPTSTTSSIQGNTIANFAWTNTGSAAWKWTGINIVSGIANIGNITSNTIGSNTGTGSVTVTNNGSNSADVIGIRYAGSGTGYIQNNKIGSIRTTSSTTFPTNIYGILKNGGTSGTLYIKNNKIGSVNDAHSINANSATNSLQQVYGISNEVAGDITISENIISNLDNSYNNATGTGSVAGINFSGGAGTNNVSGNLIHSLFSTNINSSLYGIKITSGKGTLFNNIILLGSNIPYGCNVYGIYLDGTAERNIYFNTVYLGDNNTVTSGSNNTYAFYSKANTATCDFRNNIFYNLRSGGSGTHYAISLSGISDLNIDYNDYYVPLTKILGRYNGLNKNILVDWKAATTKDANSSDLNPGFSGAGGIIVNGYKPTVALSGTAISGITTDYNAVIRAIPPTMGALESECITTTSLSASPACTGSPLNVCFTSTGTFTAGNIYTAQLSDASGNFGSSIVDLLPTLSSSASGVLWINNVIIPAGTAIGTSYRIRVVSSAPTNSSDPGIQFAIKQSPKLSLTHSDVTCANPSIGAINLTVLVGNPTVYFWTSDNGLDLTAQQNQPNLTGLTAGTYTVAVSDNNGCSAIGSATIISTTLPPAPTLTATLPCVGNQPQFTAGNGTTYQFFFNGASQGPPSAVNTFTPPRTLIDGDEVCVRSGAVDCFSETCITIHAVAAPTANNVTVCYDGAVHTATASAPGASIKYYTAPSGGTLLSGAPSSSAAGTSSTAWAEAIDNSTFCVSASRTQVNLIIKERPLIDQAANLNFCNLASGLIVFSSPSAAGGTYNWSSTQDIGFGTSGNGNNIPFFAANTTSATVVADINATYTFNGCASLPMVFHYTVFPAPVVNPLPDLTYCNGDAAPVIYFTSPTEGNLRYDWTYSGSNGSDSLVFAPVNTTDSPTTETVSVSAIDTVIGCSAGPSTTFTITVNPSPVAAIIADYCSNPGFIKLTAEPGGMASYVWKYREIPAYYTPLIIIDQAGRYSVTITNSTGCQGSAYLDMGQELVEDGSFTKFRTDAQTFYSEYEKHQGYYDGTTRYSGTMNENAYAVNVSAWSSLPATFLTPPVAGTPPPNLGYHVYMHGRDHTNNTSGPRNFMMVNGSDGIVQSPTPHNRVIWQDTVPVIYQRDYYFSAWAMNLTPGNPAKLQFEINYGTTSVRVGTVLDLSTFPTPISEAQIDISNWGRFYNTTLWTPPAGVTKVIIRIVNLNNTLEGNDFGLDDISFGLAGGIPSASSAIVNAGATVCEGDDLNFTVDSVHGGLPPYTFEWKDPNLVVFATTQNATIPFALQSNSGKYTLVVTDAHGCQSLPADRIVDVIPQPVAPIAAGVDNPELCSGYTGPIILSVTGGSGKTLEWYTDDCGGSGTLIGTTTYPVTSFAIASPPLNTTTYYARWVTNCGETSCVPVTVTVGSQWTGTSGTDWNVSGNWKAGCGVPDASKNAIISNLPINQPHINITGAACKNLTIDASASLTIDAGKSLTVNGNLINSGTLTVSSTALDNNGSLIVEGNSTGNVIYNRYLANNRWFITSPPVDNAFSLNGSTIDNPGGTYNFAPYKEPDNFGWDYVNEIPPSVNPGQGYLLKLSAGNSIQYSGSLNPTLDVLVTNTPSAGGIYDNGWNAVGNPFTSALKITGPDGFITQNLTKLETNYNAVYLWYEETGPYTGTEQFYRVINNSGYTGKAYGGPIPDSYVQAGQGFLINAGIHGTSTVTFTKGTAGMQVHSPTLTMKSSETSWPGLTLLAKNGGRTRSTVVAFNENMTTGLDPSYDAGLLSASDFNIYTHLVAGGNETDFTIQCLPVNIYESLVVPIGLDLAQAGKVTFKVAGVILPEGLYPVIEDRLLQVSIPLRTENDSLVADLAEASWGIGRFYLHTGGEAVITDVNANKDANILTARYSDQKVVIFGLPEAKSKARLYDISGRLLGGEYRLTATTRNEIPAALSNGIYLLTIEGNISRQTLKITVVN